MRFEEQDASSTLDFYYEAYGRVKSSDHKLLGKLAANSQYDEQQQKQQDTHVSANESSTSKTSSKHMITAEKRNGAKSSSSSNISTAVLTTVVAGSDNHAESKKRKIPFADNVSTVAAAAATTISSSSVISPDGTRKRAKVESEIQENVDDDLLDEAEDDQGDAMTGVEHPPAGFDTFYKLDRYNGCGGELMVTAHPHFLSYISANAGNMIRVTNIEILTDEAKLKDVFHEVWSTFP